MLKTFSLLCLILMSFLFGCQSHTQNSTANDEVTPPNIVIIFTDDQGYEDLGCYGSPDIETPNIDQMAREGLRFKNFYVSQPVCSASRSSLMTGCYANRIGIHGAYSPYVKKGLNLNEVTIAETLKPLGYATAIYGKWHLGSEPELLPTRQGFDEYFGIPYSNDMWPHHPWQGTVFNFPALPLIENETVIDTLEEQSMITTWYTEHAVDFIKRNKNNPFFLYVPQSMPHVPLFVSDKFKGKSRRGLYGDVISEIDWSVGEILRTLKEQGLDDNTLVIFTSDNGPWLSYGTHSGEAHPLREGKGTALEGGVRVPCIMRWPGKIEAGSETEKPAMTIDLLPTICAITGAALPSHLIDGRNMLGLMVGDQAYQPHHQAYYFYYHQNELQGVLSGDGRWKLYFPHKYRSLNGRVGRDDGLPIDYDQNDMGLELYDLENDISETTDVAKDHPDIVVSLQELAEQARESMGDALTGRVGKETRPVGQL
ncbi:MAG: sulfatase [Saprospiraceae bacterium]|nr:sulfatase [Saprospiraceae bacterium]